MLWKCGKRWRINKIASSVQSHFMSHTFLFCSPRIVFAVTNGNGGDGDVSVDTVPLRILPACVSKWRTCMHMRIYSISLIHSPTFIFQIKKRWKWKVFVRTKATLKLETSIGNTNKKNIWKYLWLKRKRMRQWNETDMQKHTNEEISTATRTTRMLFFLFEMWISTAKIHNYVFAFHSMFVCNEIWIELNGIEYIHTYIQLVRILLLLFNSHPECYTEV